MAKVTAFCPPQAPPPSPSPSSRPSSLVTVSFSSFPAPFFIRNRYLISGSLAGTKWGHPCITLTSRDSCLVPHTGCLWLPRILPRARGEILLVAADAQGDIAKVDPRCLFRTCSKLGCACELPATLGTVGGIAPSWLRCRLRNQRARAVSRPWRPFRYETWHGQPLQPMYLAHPYPTDCAEPRGDCMYCELPLLTSTGQVVPDFPVL